MSRALTLEPFQSLEFDVAGVARMLLEDLSGAAPARTQSADATPPAEPVIDPDSPDHKAGFEAGYNAATEEAAAELAAAIARADAAEARVAALEPQLAGALAAMDQTRRSAERRMAEDSAAILGAAFEALLPEFARRGFAAEAAATVREWLSRAASAEGVLYVPEGFEAELAAAVAAAGGEEARVRVAADAALAPGAARFEWRDGLGELDLNESAARIRAAFDAHLDRLGLAQAAAARALTPPHAPAEATAPTPPEAEAAANATPEAEPEKKLETNPSARRRPKAAASDAASADAAPKKRAARSRSAAKSKESATPSDRAEAPADAAPEKTVKKAASRRRASGETTPAKTTSGESHD